MTVARKYALHHIACKHPSTSLIDFWINHFNSLTKEVQQDWKTKLNKK